MKKGKNIPGKLEFHDEKTEKEAEFHTDDMLRTSKATVKEKILLDAAKTLNDLEETVRTEEKQGTDETLSDLLSIPRDNIL